MRQGWIAATLALACAGPAAAQSPDALYTRSLAATCAHCHGTDGKGTPAIAGMPRDYLSAQLKAFKTGARPATIMHQLSKGYTDAQLDQLAAYFAAQKK